MEKMEKMENWNHNDHYLAHALVKETAPFTAATEKIRHTNYPQMEVSPLQGKFLYLLTKITGATNVLEIGTFFGYSTMWFAQALPDHGKITSIELTEKFVHMAEENLQNAGLLHKANLIHGDANILLEEYAKAGHPPYDMIFIDAHKPSYPNYLRLALQLSRPGTVIIGDNIILDGQLANMENNNPKAKNVRQFIDDLARLENIESTALQTVGIKGYDGFTVSLVK